VHWLRRVLDRLAARLAGHGIQAGGGDGPGGVAPAAAPQRRKRNAESEVAAMLLETSLQDFSERLAAGTPTPGGGSAAALAGALSASLLRMVCDLTIGREKYRAHEPAVQAIRQRAEGLRQDLLALVDRDAQAYDRVIEALRMPKGSAAERQERAAALARASQFATETPMAISDACAVLLALSAELAAKGNPHAISDIGSAALLAYAALRGGVMNVRMNLKGLGDEARATRLLERVRRLEVDAERAREDALGGIAGRMNGT
jgi:methenyltetrahydrofolate cyclohydrolase